jgi:uncharacterized damage-inducible protein DinB
MTLDDLLDAWRVNNAINLEFLDVCSDEDLELKPGKGKTIRSNFVHLISVRRMWCEEKLKAEAATIPKLDWKTATRGEIRSGLEVSSEVMMKMFRHREGQTEPSTWPTIGFFAYCVAHEAHHRSQIEISLRIGGREPDDKFLYATWEWSKKERVSR